MNSMSEEKQTPRWQLSQQARETNQANIEAAGARGVHSSLIDQAIDAWEREPDLLAKVSEERDRAERYLGYCQQKDARWERHRGHVKSLGTLLEQKNRKIAELKNQGLLYLEKGEIVGNEDGSATSTKLERAVKRANQLQNAIGQYKSQNQPLRQKVTIQKHALSRLRRLLADLLPYLEAMEGTEQATSVRTALVETSEFGDVTRWIAEGHSSASPDIWERLRVAEAKLTQLQDLLGESNHEKR